MTVVSREGRLSKKTRRRLFAGSLAHQKAALEFQVMLDAASPAEVAALRQAFADAENAANCLESRFDVVQRLENDLQTAREENKELSKQLSELSTRVAVLEEGRKTTAAEVKVAVTETLARLEIAWLREDAKRQVAEAAKKEDAA